MKIDFSQPYEVIDLAHAMTEEMPSFPSAPPFTMVPKYRLGDFELANGYWGSNEFITMSGHSGTHLDAFGHVAQDRKVFGGGLALEAQDGARGLIQNAIDQVAPIVRRGVLLDVAGFFGVESLDPGYAITPRNIVDTAAWAGVVFEKGDCVLIRTGWDRFWDSPHHYLGYEGGVPGIDLEAAKLLADRGVFLLGADNGGVEVGHAVESELPVHMEALVQRGIHLLENMSLAELASRGRSEFVFMCSPLKIRGASGSPVRPAAIFQK
jgi:kynurenine formamidase